MKSGADDDSGQLTPQEQNLYWHHYFNLKGGGAVQQPGGEVSTIYQTPVEGPGGRYYNIPTVWDGQILTVPEARDRAAAVPGGMESWPSYATPEAADLAYEARVHPLAASDEPAYRSLREALVPGTGPSSMVEALRSGDPEAAGAVESSQAMEPVVGPYLRDVVTGRAAMESLREHFGPNANPIDIALAFSGGGLGIKAYHGSPYDFAAFDASKIGTGEGAAKYGHGLYFSEKPEVAESYKKQLTGLNPNQMGSGKARFGVNDVPMPTGISGHAALDTGNDMDLLLGVLHHTPDSSMIPFLHQKIQSRINNFDMQSGGSAGDDMRAMADYYNQHVRNATPDQVSEIAPGRMYEVDINAEPHHLLDWDKPLSDQPQRVSDAIADLAAAQRVQMGNATGARAYTDLAEKLGGTFGAPAEIRSAGAKKASETLQQSGVPGIRYLDQGSRGAGQGTSNYVVFNPNLIRILRKYGIAPPLAAGAGAGAMALGDGEAKAAETKDAPTPASETFRQEVIRHESGGRPNIGWKNTDLTPYIESGQVTKHGFPDWPGKPSGTFDKNGKELPSTAGGLYGITKTNWEKYAPLVGVSDFSEASQTKVYNRMYAESGEAPWRPYWQGGTAAGVLGRQRLGGKAFGLADDDGLEEESDRRERDRQRARFAKFAADHAPTEEVALTSAPAAAPAAPAPSTAAKADIRPPRPSLPDIYVPKAPQLHQAFQQALASILQPKRNPLEEVLRR